MAGLSQLVETEREADRRTLVTSITAVEKAADKMAEQLQRLADRMSASVSRHEYDASHTALQSGLDAEIEKVDARLRALESAVADMKAQTVPRAEVRLLIDNVQTRQDNIAKSVSDLNQILVAMRSEMQGQETEATQQQDQATRTRNLIFASIGAIAALTGGAVALITALHL